MQEKSIIKQNILKYLDFIGITQYKFYQITGITRGVLGQNNGMSEENTSRFLDCFREVSPEWLLTGKGNMLKEEVSTGFGIFTKNKYNLIKTNTNSANCKNKCIFAILIISIRF